MQSAKRLKWLRAQGVLATIAFVLLLIGSNLPNPMLRLYRDDLGFTPFLLTSTYVVYVGILIIGLFTLSSPSMMRFAPRLIVVALLLAAGAHLFLAQASAPMIMVGRVLTGIAGAYGTGASSALVVNAFGAHGRAITATGTMIGAVLVIGSALLAVSLLGIDAMHLVPVVHASICVVVLISLAMTLAVRRGDLVNELTNAPADRVDWDGSWTARANFVPIAAGCTVWAIISLSVVWYQFSFSIRTCRWCQSWGS